MKASFVRKEMARASNLLQLINMSRLSKIIVLALTLMFLQNINADVSRATPACINGSATAVCVLDNSALRFGTGSENSLTAQGNLAQPWYRSPVNGTYYKLTYANYPLNMAVGFGTGGGNWTGASTIMDLLQDNPTIGAHTEDWSGFIVTATVAGSPTVYKGYGVVISTTSVTLNSTTFQIINTYTLGATDKFIKIQSIIKNVNISSVSNVHVWVGTQDDWVGSTDQPTKIRGNLNGTGGAFQQLTNATDQSQALEVVSASEGALFYSDTPNTNTAYNSCCSFSNVYNQDPSLSSFYGGATNHINSGSMDGSYALVLSAGDLATNASFSITWYYAAGALADLSAVSQAVSSAAAPQVPAVTQGYETATVSWDVPAATGTITGYAIRYTSDGGANWTNFSGNPLPASPTTAIVTGLTPGLNYLFQVAAITVPIGGGSSSQGAWSASSPTVQNLGAPESPTVTSLILNGTSAVTTFTPAANPGSAITNYEYSLDAGATWSGFAPAITSSPGMINNLILGSSYNLQLRAVNGQGSGAAGSYGAFVTLPAWVDSATATPAIGIAYNDGVSASSAITYSLSSGALPTGLLLNASTGAITGTPTGAARNYSFTVTATNAAGSISKTFSGAVTPAAGYPVILVSTLTFTLGIVESATVLASGGTAYTITGTLPPGITFDTATATISGTPTSAVSYNFTITSTNATGSSIATYSGTVVSQQIAIQSPVTGDVITGKVGVTLTYSLQLSGGSGSDTATVSAGLLPGGIVLSPQGEFSGTPTSAGTYSISILVTDALGQTATVSGVDFVISPATPVIIPDPVQLSLITGISTRRGPASGGGLVVVTGYFPRRVSNISIDNPLLPQSLWSQTGSSVTITMPRHAVGVVSVQIYNGAVPLLEPFTYEYVNEVWVPTPTPTPTPSPSATPTPTPTPSPSATPTPTPTPTPTNTKPVKVPTSTLKVGSAKMIAFEFGKFNLDSSALKILKALPISRKAIVEVVGFASATSGAADLRISLDRAIEVKKALLKTRPDLVVRARGGGVTKSALCLSSKNQCAVIKILHT